MALDPFEARLQFIQIVETLNPSSMTLSKAIGYALKNQELHEDFHSVILEMLDKIDLNQRMNVMYFLELLVSTVATQSSSKDFKEKPYLNNIRRDFAAILQKVVPKESLVNLSGCVDTLKEVEKFYPGVDNAELRNTYVRLSLDNATEKIEDVDEGFAKAWKYLAERKKAGLLSRLKQLSDHSTEDPLVTEENGVEPLTHKQILQRMENDRERHKRYKETNWVVNRPTGKISEEEFGKIWNQFGQLGEDDFQEMRELYKTAGESYQV